MAQRWGGESIAGVAVFCGVLTGLAGLFVALVTFVNGDHVATGICLVAAGIAFGLVANASLRN
jgi:hypothetical protein